MQTSPNLLEELGLDKLPPEQQQQFIERIGTIIYKGTVMRVLDQMSDAEQAALEAFIGEHQEDPEAVFGYMREHVGNLETIMQEEIARFKADAAHLFKGIA